MWLPSREALPTMLALASSFQGKYAERMNREEMIQHARVFVGSSEQDDQELVSVLFRQGVDLETAERFVAFLPIAFGRVILRAIAPMKFSTSFIIHETG